VGLGSALEIISAKEKPISNADLACLHYMIKTKVFFFWRAGFFLANQSFLITFEIALIGWIKAGPLKKPLLF